jgi:SAM-dependent methyltransferase
MTGQSDQVSESGQAPEPRPADAETFWDRRYADQNKVWSGRVNPVLADVASRLEVGTALDLGCGEGGDSVWLAGMGWRVTGVDISRTALARAERAAADAGVGSRISFEQYDLAADFPSGSFDLVSAQFLHSPMEFPHADVLRRAAQAVVPGGRLLVVEHGAPPPWMTDHDHPPFAPVQQTYDELELNADYWRTERLATAEREATGPDGQAGRLLDNIILVCRLA